MVKPPLSVRSDPERHEAFLVLREGVPASLMPSLLDWVVDHYVDRWLTGSEIRIEPVRRLERRTDRTLPLTDHELMAMFGESPTLLLDAVDLALTDSADLDAATALSDMLHDARSAYTVGVDGDGNHELQLRQPPELTATAEAALSGTGSASRHLRRAWSLAFGREPEPTAACDEAVRAIEAVATAVVAPNDPLPTLGKMIAAMRDAAHKWTTDSNATDDISAVVAMLELVWMGYRRHGDPRQPAEATVQAAQMLTQTATLLVHWFQSGHIRRTTT